MDLLPQYVAIIAVEAAVEAERAFVAPPKVQPPDPKCPKCKGTGKVKTGDGQHWTACGCTERKDCPTGVCPIR